MAGYEGAVKNELNKNHQSTGARKPQLKFDSPLNERRKANRIDETEKEVN
jgi:hypothetical protein